jgi:hypothetical protein
LRDQIIRADFFGPLLDFDRLRNAIPVRRVRCNDNVRRAAVRDVRANLMGIVSIIVDQENAVALVA